MFSLFRCPEFRSHRLLNLNFSVRLNGSTTHASGSPPRRRASGTAAPDKPAWPEEKGESKQRWQAKKYLDTEQICSLIVASYAIRIFPNHCSGHLMSSPPPIKNYQHTVGIWNPDMSIFQMVKKEVGLQMVWILNSTWNLEAWPFEIWTNGCHFVKNHLKSGQ